MNYKEYSEEALIAMLMENPNDGEVLETLTCRLRPTILGEALKYRSLLPFDTDDYLQEGRIVLWQIAVKKNYKKGSFKNYFISAIRFRYCNLYREYVLKNLIRIGGYEDIRGNTYEILVEADYAKQYREKHCKECKKSNERKKAKEGAPVKQPKPKLTEEELIARRRARSRAYYYAHADEMNQRDKDKRKAKREKREAEMALEKAVRETQKAALKALKEAAKREAREAREAQRAAGRAAKKAAKAPLTPCPV